MVLEEGSRPVTILSIDGGGVHGVVPAVLLQQLETYLKEELEEEGEYDVEVRIADYFDVIAGTGIGSLIASMLCKKPEPSNMSEILEALEDISEKAFPNDYKKSIIERVGWGISATWDICSSYVIGRFRGTPYQFDERYWERSWEEQTSPSQQFSSKLNKYLGNTQLDQTVTNLIVPAYHFDTARPMVFSSYAYSQSQAVKKEGEGEGIRLKDVVRGSSATPTVLPFYDMGNKSYKGLTGTFADGSIVANNPSMLAVEEGAMIYGSEEKFKNYMVLSLGTVRRQLPTRLFKEPLNLTVGIVQQIIQQVTSFNLYTDIVAGFLQYMYIFFNAMTELYMSRLFPTQPHSSFSSNYLRLQAYVELNRAVPSILNGSKEAFDKLKLLAYSNILIQQANYVHPYTGARYKQKYTNQEALREFARRLHLRKKIKDEYKNKMKIDD